MEVQKLPDPQGMIARVRARLPKNCAVKLSPFCEIIISMRMQGIPFRDVEKWLIEQGKEYRISASTLYRNLARCKMTIELPYAEEIAEKYGGRIDLDLARELSGQILAQRRRIDSMQRMEMERQKKSPTWYDKRLRGERETLMNLIKTLHGMLKSPLAAAQDAMEASALLAKADVNLSEDASAVIKEMILSGELKIGDETFH